MAAQNLGNIRKKSESSSVLHAVTIVSSSLPNDETWLSALGRTTLGLGAALPLSFSEQWLVVVTLFPPLSQCLVAVASPKCLKSNRRRVASSRDGTGCPHPLCGVRFFSLPTTDRIAPAVSGSPLLRPSSLTLLMSTATTMSVLVLVMAMDSIDDEK